MGKAELVAVILQVMPGLARPVVSNRWFWFPESAINGRIAISSCELQYSMFGTLLSLFDVLATFVVIIENQHSPCPIQKRSFNGASMSFDDALYVRQEVLDSYMAISAVVMPKSEKFATVGALRTFGDHIWILDIVPGKLPMPQGT
jgi:hypothetical protein